MEGAGEKAQAGESGYESGEMVSQGYSIFPESVLIAEL